jgi:hypothetical protein
VAFGGLLEGYGDHGHDRRRPAAGRR